MSVSCGIPHESVLGPVLFVMFIVDVIKLVEDCGLTLHACVDDLQVCSHSTQAQSSQLMSSIVECIKLAQVWVASNRFSWIHRRPSLNGSVLPVVVCWSPTMRSLPGANLQPSSMLITLEWSQLWSVYGCILATLQVCASLICIHSSLFDTYHWCNMKSCPGTDSRLDYCSSFLAGLPAGQMIRLQSVLHAAGRFVLQLPGRDSVSAVNDFIGSSVHNGKPTSCVLWPAIVSMNSVLLTWHGSVSHSLLSPVGVNYVQMKFINCSFHESEQLWWSFEASTMLVWHCGMPSRLFSMIQIWHFLNSDRWKLFCLFNGLCLDITAHAFFAIFILIWHVWNVCLLLLCLSHHHM